MLLRNLLPGKPVFRKPARRDRDVERDLRAVEAAAELARKAQVAGRGHGNQGLHRARNVHQRFKGYHPTLQRRAAGSGPGVGLQFRRGRVDIQKQAKTVQAWWRKVSVERRVRGLEEFAAWLARKREGREIEVQFAACTIQAFWSVRATPSPPSSPKSVAAVNAGLGQRSQEACYQKMIHQNMYDHQETCRRLGKVQARLTALGKARVRQCQGCSTIARRKDLARLHRKKCLGVRQSRVTQCKACLAGQRCAHLRTVMDMGDEELDAFWFRWRAEL